MGPSFHSYPFVGPFFGRIPTLQVEPVEANLQEHQLHALKQGPPETKRRFTGGGGGVYYVQIVRFERIGKNSTNL